jgi:hypothetical protein
MIDETGEPRVGIFWMLADGSLLVDSSPLSAAEGYADCLTHSRSHIDVWAELQSSGRAPTDVEYEEYPRGRVIFDTRQDRWVIMADRCILRRKDLMRKISALTNLSGMRTETSPDSHYRCSRCLYGSRGENQHEP